MSGFETEVDGREEPPKHLLHRIPGKPFGRVPRLLVEPSWLAFSWPWPEHGSRRSSRTASALSKMWSMARSVRGTHLEIGNAAQNAAVAYASLGAILSLCLAITAGCLLPRFSLTRIMTAGLAGIALGGLFGAASSYVLTPVYLHRLGTADVTLTVLIHLAIWCAVGAAAGVAFAIGCGTRKAFAGSLIGGIAGAALAVLVFDVGGAFLPLAHTERPLAEVGGTRLAAAALLSVFVVFGIVIVALQEPRAKVPGALEH